MEPILVPPDRDPEFRPVGGARLIARDQAPAAYQRLVANPFLGLLGFLIWGGALYLLLGRHLAGSYSVSLAIPAGLSIIGLPRLFHYHCRDCGATGPFLLWRQHSCPSVITRRITGRPRRLRGPTPPIQMLLWFYVLLTVLIVVALRW